MNFPDLTPSYGDDREITEVEGNPDIEKNYIKGALFLLFVLAIALLIVTVIMNPGTFPVRSVRIEGEFRHLSPAVLKESVIDVVRGGFFNVNVETIQKVLINNPWVDKVNVLRIWPDGIKVQVLEKIPVARWKDEGLLSTEGKFFIPEDKYMPDSLPVLSGPDNTYQLLLTRYEFIRKVLADKELEISELTLNSRRAWDFRLKNDIKVIIGKGQIETRIKRFTYYAWPALKTNAMRISRIDMRYTNGFVVSWNDIDDQNFEMGKQEHG